MFRQSLALRGIGPVRHLVPKRFKSSAVGLGIWIWVFGARRLTRKTLRCTLAAKVINIHTTCFNAKDHHGESIFWLHDLSLFKQILAENNANAYQQAVFVEAGPRHYFAAAMIDSGIELIGFCTSLYRRYPKKYQHYLDKGFFHRWRYKYKLLRGSNILDCLFGNRRRRERGVAG